VALLSKIDNVHRDVVLLESLSKFLQFIDVFVYGAANEHDDSLLLVLVLAMLQNQLCSSQKKKKKERKKERGE
jgi:hypothetical protein